MEIKNYFNFVTQENSLSKRFINAKFLNIGLGLLLLSAFFTSTMFAQQHTVVLTTGSSWTVPANADISSITVKCWGAGGGGSYASTSSSAGGAGGGGAFAQSVFTSFAAGQVVNYQIGAGGLGTSGTNSGGATWFYMNAVGGVSAAGGAGAANNSTAGGLGGSAAASIGSVTFSGGKGGNGSYSSGAVCGDELASGGGGAAATSLINGANGANASTSTGGVFCSGNHSTAGNGASNLLHTGYESKGGKGVEYSGLGLVGTNGAGGSGGVSATYNGGAGGNGLIVISYDIIDCSRTGIDTQIACDRYTWINGVEYTSNINTPTHTIVGGASNGCDSIVTLNLTINTVEISTSQMNGVVLSANAAGASYQWINCATNNPISGATNQIYTATANGSYAVIVTKNGCSDTSACLTVTTASLQDLQAISGVHIFPNPTKELLTVRIENMQEGEHTIELLDATGRVISTQMMNDHSTTVSLIDFKAGVYMVRILNGDRQSIQRVIKQ